MQPEDYKTFCVVCRHARTSHSKDGCVECTCNIPYMQKSSFRKKAK